VDAWIAGSRLLEVIIPDGADMTPSSFPSDSSGSQELLFWNVDPSFDEKLLRQSAQEVISKVVSKEGAGANTATPQVLTCRFVQDCSVAPTAFIMLSSAMASKAAEITRAELQTITSASNGKATSCVMWRSDVAFVLRPSMTDGNLRFMPNYGKTATLSMIPGRPKPAVLVCIDAIPRNIRCAASAEWAKEKPEALVDCQISWRQGKGQTWIKGEVVSYIPKLCRHVLLTGHETVQLVNLNEPNFIVEPMLPGLIPCNPSMLAWPGCNICSCVACYTTPRRILIAGPNFALSAIKWMGMKLMCRARATCERCVKLV